MALTKIKNISIDPDFRITGTEIADVFTLTSRTVTVTTPTANTEAANKAYVDNSIAALRNFKTIAVTGQTNVVADTAEATLTFVNGTGITVTTDAATDAITFTADATSNSVANKLVIRDGSGNFSAGVITATSLTGRFTTARDIQLTGDVTGTIGFDGSANVQLSTTLANSGVAAQTYGSTTQVGQFVVSAKGIITSASNVGIAIPSTAVTDFQEAVEDTFSASILAGTHSGITFTYNDTTGALSSSLDSANKFQTIAVSGQDNVEADTATDTLTFAGSTGLTITTTAGTDTVTFTNSGVTSAAVSGTGLTINAATGAVTVTSDATALNTFGTIVARDASGNFAATVITSDLTGNVQGNVTGNITSAGSSSFANIDVNGGAIDSAIIGGTAPAAITGTVITADTNFVGALTGNVTGDITSTGTSSFTGIDVNGGTIDGTAIGNSTPSTGDFTAVTTTGDLDVASGVLFVNTTTDRVGVNNPTPAEALDVVGNSIISGDLSVGQDVTITGTLTVLGGTTTVESTVTTVVDPVFTIGQGTYVSNDGKARGIEFKYYSGQQRTGFFGYDTTDGVYKLLTAASNNSEVFTGTKATLSANLDGSLGTARKIELTSDVTGEVMFDGSANVQIASTLANTAVTAGVYGAADKVAVFTVDTKGRLTAANESQISILSSQVTDFNEAAMDAASSMIVNGTHTNVTVTYNDAGNVLNFSVPGAQSFSNVAVSGQSTVAADQASDTVTFAGSTGLTITTNDATDTVTFTNSGVTSAAVSGTGLTISGATGAVTVTSNATDANTASTVVARDASGNFTAGTITAALTGNASTATAWATGRTITLTGDVTGVSGTFDGSGNLSFATTIAADSVALGTDTTGNYVASISDGSGISITNGSGEGATPVVSNSDKGSDQFIFKSIIVAGETTVAAASNTEALTLVAGTGVTIDTDNTTKTITFANSGLPTFKHVAISGQTTVTADQSDDTLTLVGGTAISITADAITDAITFNNDGVTSFGVVAAGGLSVNAATGVVTLTSNATPNNTVSTIVMRDANGAFNAGDIGVQDISADTLTTTAGVTVGTLTATRVTFAGTAGLLSDSAGLTFNSGTSTLTATNVSATAVTSTSVTDSGLTATRVTFAGVGGLLSDASTLTFNTGTNTLSTTTVSATTVEGATLKSSGLTSGRVAIIGASGAIADDNSLTYDATTNVLTASGLSVSTVTGLSSITASTTLGINATGNITLDPGAGHFIDASTHKIINVVDPTADQHAATKKYVDDAVSAAIILTVDGDTGSTAVDLVADTFTIAGTANQITTAVTADTATLSLPSALIAPGSVSVTTTLGVTGATTLAGVSATTVNATGAVTLGTTLGVTGATTLTTLTTSGNVIVGGNLTVNGTTTSVNSTTVDVADLNLTLAKGSATSAAANGAGITIDGANATISYAHATTSFDINKPVIVTGDVTATTFKGAVDATTVTASSLTATRVTFAGTAGLLSDASTLTFTTGTNTLATTNVTADDMVTGGITVGDLTSGRIPVAGAGGLLADTSTLTFNTGTNTLATTNVSATAVTSTSITNSGLTSGRVTFSGVGGLQSDSTDLTYNTATQTLSVPKLSVTNFELGNLTSGRVTFAGANGALVDDADMTFNTTTNTLSVVGVASTNLTASSLTATRVTFAGTAGLLSDSAGLTFAGGVLTSTTGFAGPLTGAVTGNVTGNLTGAVTGNVTGNLTGNVTGNVAGNVTGNVTGNLTGNVTGQVSDLSNRSIGDLSDVDLAGVIDQDTLRWNATAGAFEPSSMSGFQMRRGRFTANGSSASFTLANAPEGRDFLIVTVSGVPQAGDTFSVAGTTLTLGGTPQAGEIVEVIDFSTGVFSPAPNSSDDVAEGSSNFYYTDTRVKTLMGNGTFNSNIIPATTNTYDLGSAAKAFSNVYVSGSGKMTFGSIYIKNNSGTLQFLNVADDSYALVDLGITLDTDVSIDGGSY